METILNHHLDKKGKNSSNNQTQNSPYLHHVIIIYRENIKYFNKTTKTT